MAINSFRNNSIIKDFNGLKRFFRTHETNVSKERINDFKKFSEMLNSSGDMIAFDFLGSVNFGQAMEYSDTDVVVYIDCISANGEFHECDISNCSKLALYKNLLINSLVYEYSKRAYEIHVVDSINLLQLDKDIQERNFNSLTLIKFGFYRSICRGVNRRLLRQYEVKLSKDIELCLSIEKSLTECFLGLLHSSQHSYSFKKYMERIEDFGFVIPETMEKKIYSYLDSL